MTCCESGGPLLRPRPPYLTPLPHPLLSSLIHTCFYLEGRRRGGLNNSSKYYPNYNMA